MTPAARPDRSKMVTPEGRGSRAHRRGRAARIHVLIGEPDDIVRAGLTSILASAPDMTIVGAVADGRTAARLQQGFRPDVVLRNAGLSGWDSPGDGGRPLANARVIIFTSHAGDEHVYRALKAGARGVLLGSASAAELLNAIRIVHGGGRYLPAELSSALAERAGRLELTRREVQVLSLLVQGEHNTAIAAARGIGTGTVKWHVSAIFSKLGVTRRTEAVAAAL